MSMNLSSLFLILLPVVLALEWPPDADICQDVVCKKPKGSWCTPGEKNGKLKAVCECPENCPDVYQPVCSVYGRQYENLCKLHEYTCKKGKNIPMAYNGICIASQKKCKDDEFQQFPVRLLDWFLHLHEIDQFGRLDPNTNIKQKTPQERSMYATWKFNQLDDDGDGKLDKKDLLNFRYSLMPLEHCASDFFKTCANKKAKKITLEGWLQCLKKGKKKASSSISLARRTLDDSIDLRPLSDSEDLFETVDMEFDNIKLKQKVQELEEEIKALKEQLDIQDTVKQLKRVVKKLTSVSSLDTSSQEAPVAGEEEVSLIEQTQSFQHLRYKPSDDGVYDTVEYPQPEEGVTEEVDEDLDDDIADFFGDDDDEE